MSEKQRGAWRRFLDIAVLTVFLLVGYNSMGAQQQSCQAQQTGNLVVIPGIPMNPVLPTACGCGGVNTVPCSIIGSTAIVTGTIEAAYYAALTASSVAVENYIGMAVDTLVQAVFSRLEQMEKDIGEWFKTFWYYNQLPAMQEMTEQSNTSQMEQVRDIAAITDAEQTNQTMLAHSRQAAASTIAASEAASDEVCAVGSSSAGLGNANAFSRAMRRAWQNGYTARALQKRGERGATGSAAALADDAKEFEDLFCDPRDNNGRNACGTTDPAFYNADVQVTSRLLNKLTIPVDQDERTNVALNSMLDNMTGRPRLNLISGNEILSAAGREEWVRRRSYLARKNAARALPTLIASWRIPGGSNCGNGGGEASETTPVAGTTGNAAPAAGSTGTGSTAPSNPTSCSFATALREGAGIDLAQLSQNPSYREIVHAVTIDRFNSGTYALDKVGTPERQEMEKIVLSAFYLMQLRDYYELMERTALDLAVQVSVLADHAPITPPVNAGGSR